jgi:F420-non-reducing hydrogenase large subunit
MTHVTIDPVTRLEGHGKIEILLDGAGEVEHTYFQVPELRGFERFCVGRPIEEMPTLTSRICGVCPEAHHMAAAKAVDAVYRVTPPRAATLLRELLYSAFVATDHTTHFYVLSGPDFLVGPDAPPAERNILGVVHKVGADIGLRVIEARKRGHEIIETIGGRKVHPLTAVPGGMTKGITEDERAAIEASGRWMVDFARFSLDLWDSAILGNDEYVGMIRGDTYTHETYYMGVVDAAGRLNMYDGQVRVVGPDGTLHGQYPPADYPEWIAERVEPWTYLKFPYLRKVGWKGLVDGPESGVYCVGPLGRINAADGMGTPLAQEAYERFYSVLAPPVDGRKRMVHPRLAMHWARLVELLSAAERVVELATDPEVTSDVVRVVPSEPPTEGVGTIEAPRGTLTHHYWTDERGLVTKVNLIVGTTNNYAPMALSIERAARSLIHGGEVVSPGLLNRIEMAFRAYDPCFGCATHSLTGEMPLEVTIRDANGDPVDVLRQAC